MYLGKARPQIALSCSRRRIRLGVAHHGAPSTYTAPSKDQPAPPARGRGKKQRR
jgi:hypothetical protein